MKPSVPAVSDTRRPGEGFYTFVNETWLKTHHIKSWQGEYGVSDEMTNETDKELLEILHTLKTPKGLSPNTARSHLEILGYIWKNRLVKHEEAYLQVCLHEIISFKTSQDLGRTLGWMVRCGIPTIIQYDVREEIQSPYLTRTTLSTGSLLLPIKYYLDPSLMNSDVWKSYEEFISICAIELGLPFLHKAIKSEKSLAPILDESFNHLAQSKKGSSLKSWMPDFEWSAFMEGLDVDTSWERRIWVINATERFKDVLKCVCRLDEESIISIFALHLIRISAPYLRPSIKNAYSNLFYKALRGVDSEPPLEQRMLADVKDILPDALCSLYSKKHYNKQVINDVSSIVSNLKESAVELMTDTYVFSKRTKSKVKEKIHRMWFELGKGKESPLPEVTYTPDSLLHSIFSVKSARSKYMVSLTGKSADKIHSSYPCFITNASYFEETNHIVIPWGILQWPFYHINAPLGWNHGGIGATIGHEMTHGFDLDGSLYTPRGIYKEWWTRKNRNSFKKQTRKVSRFFSKFKHFGKKVDGKKTLSENWSDLGGLKISLHSLRKLLEGKSEIVKKEAYRNFFIAYAVSWRTLVRKKTLLYSILTSVHAPSDDRVDRIVPQFQEWVDAFDIKETDALYLSEGKRLKFF